MIETHYLTWLVLSPLLGALVVLALPRSAQALIRGTSLFFTSFAFLFSLRLLRENWKDGAYHLVENVPWITTFGISYKVGVDGIALWLILLTTFMTPLALFASWPSIHDKLKEYAFCFLLLEASMLGAFVAIDIFLFYVFWELMLVPMLLIVGLWGGQRRVYAAVKFFLYTLVGSLLMLGAILYLVSRHNDISGALTFDLEALTGTLLSHREQAVLFSAFALAFAIKVPMFPLHTWLPDAHVEAPTGGSVILAAVLLKFGCYGFLRFAMPLFPWAAHQAAPTLALLSVVGVIYGAYCAWVQNDVKKLVAYSSVSHLGFIMVGLLAMNVTGIKGAVLQMVAHGISTGALFLLVGVVYERRHTRELEQFGGLASIMPIYALIFIVVSMSSVGLPSTNGFVGEFLILVGTFTSNRLPQPFFTAAMTALGVILSAVYMLHAVLKMFWGPVTREANKGLSDMNLREIAVLSPLVLFIFWMGVYPNTFLKPMVPAVTKLVSQYNTRLLETYRDETPRQLGAGPTQIGMNR